MKEVKIVEHDTQVNGDLYNVDSSLGLVIIPCTDKNGRRSNRVKKLINYFNDNEVAVLTLDLVSEEESKKKEFRYIVHYLSIIQCFCLR